MRPVIISTFILACILYPVGPAPSQEIAFETWTIPGEGAGPLVVNPADGSLWTFCHQTGNLVCLNATDGSVILDLPLSIRPTALAFSPDGSVGFMAGESLGDQIIDAGVVQMIDPVNGHILTQLEIEGACNAVHVTGPETLYVACGMQYAYQGNVHKLIVLTDDEGAISLEIESSAACGKIPWAIATADGYLYVTDLELQWAAQPDGSMGPPYGAWVWIYDADSLEFIDSSWVGISPSRLCVTDLGVLVACSGSKQSEGEWIEPALSLITSPGESEPIYIESTGASDLTVAPDGSWAVVSLADWGPPAAGSAIAMLQSAMPGRFPEARRWSYTGDLAIVTIEDDRISTSRREILPDSFIRTIAVSLDGSRVFALQGDPEQILVIPVEILE